MANHGAVTIEAPQRATSAIHWSLSQSCRRDKALASPLNAGDGQLSGGGYKGKKRSKSRHTRLEEWFQATEAWATLRPGPRALYLELKRRFNGGNNGAIRMSVREAADLLNVHRNTVATYFADLVERGLIVQTRAGHLGFEGHGIASTWALCEMRQVNGRSADLDFRKWKS